MSSAITRIENLKVTEENPPHDDLDGLDFHRCAALHNAIIEHGWTASGRPIEDMPRITWWDLHSEAPDLDATVSRLHTSVIEFLKLAYHFYEKNFNFFHYLTSLRGVGGIEMSFKEDLDDPDYDHRYYTLYCTDQTHASKPDGLVYDQATHMCLLVLNTYDEYAEETLPWQKLESVLTVYIELIENVKVVAFHKDLEYPGDWAFYEAPDPALSGHLPASQRPNAMLVDPATRHAKKQGIVDPWMCVSSTESDLDDSLWVWKLLVEAIHDRMGLSNDDTTPVYGLADDQLLEVMPDGFAKKFFASALKPLCKYIAPGLRVQTIDELRDQPYASSFSAEGTKIPPVLIVRGDGMAVPTAPLGDYPHISIPVGLYLEPCDRFDDAAPWEDGAALILPYNLGGNDSWARMYDQQPLPEGNDSLYQIGRNPFIAPHPTQLNAILMHWYKNLMRGNWTVNADGVADGIDKYREADTEEHCMEYVVEIGPGMPV